MLLNQRMRVPQVGNVTLCLVVWIAELTLFWNGGQASTAAWVSAVIYTGLGSSILYFRKQFPLAAFCLAWVHSISGSLFVPGYRPTLYVWILLYAVALRCSLRTSLFAFLASLFAALPAVLDEVGRPTAGSDRERFWSVVTAIVGYTLVPALLAAAGRRMGGSTRRIAELEVRRQADAREAAEAERRRLARELHDVVSHSVSLMVLQAGGGDRFLDKDPAKAAAAFHAIEETGQKAMDELRRLLVVMRRFEDEAGTGGRESGATPGSSHLQELLTEMSPAGLDVQTDVTGRARDLKPEVDLVLYSVLRESLMNVAKHVGPGSRCSVQLSWLPDKLRVRVEDLGDGQPQPTLSSFSTGHGLAGLRERVEASGGRLDHGALPGRGFFVEALLPAPGPAAAEDKDWSHNLTSWARHGLARVFPHSARPQERLP